MRRTIECVDMLITLLIISLVSSLVSAQTVVINFTDRGWYKSSGFHELGNGNYVVGKLGDGFGPAGPLYREYRNYFVFDLAGVSQPIASAKLALYTGYFHSLAGSENYELHDVVTSIAALVAGTGGVAAYTDLGSGIVYGSRAMTYADEYNVVEIELTSSALTAMNATHGLFGIGGKLTTLISIQDTENVFGFTGADTDVTQLRLTFIPEPSTLLLLGIGAISLLGYRKAKS